MFTPLPTTRATERLQDLLWLKRRAINLVQLVDEAIEAESARIRGHFAEYEDKRSADAEAAMYEQNKLDQDRERKRRARESKCRPTRTST